MAEAEPSADQPEAARPAVQVDSSPSAVAAAAAAAVCSSSPSSSSAPCSIAVQQQQQPAKQPEDVSSQTRQECNVALSTPGGADDPMLGFLTLLAKVERPACANCESKDLSPMFYCNTCGQAICAVCKQNTHSAKMFSRHDVTSVSPYTKEPQRKCPVHNEMCIMFSPANESLLCINCFRDLPPDIRAQCLDLDTAYQHKCERLQRGLKAVAELEVTIKDEISAYRALLKELHINAMREESTIHVFSKILQGVVTQTEERLIDAVKGELQTKELVFEEKLKTLESLQNNVQAYLTLSTAFISSASKFDLLKLANGLVERLSDIGNVVQPTRLSPENSTISSNFKAEFSNSLKELLHQELWMHNHFPTLNDLTPTPIASKEVKGEEKKVQKPQSKQETSSVKQAEKAVIKLPFLGRSQSLLNISLNLDRTQQQVTETKSTATQQPNPAAQNSVSSSSSQPPSRRATTKSTSTRRSPGTSKADVRYQSLPSNNKDGQKQQRRPTSSTMPHPVRSKSVDAKSAAAIAATVAAQQQHAYDLGQLELFATIHQSRQAITHRSNSKNLTVTSALVGVRQSAERNGPRPEHIAGKPSDPVDKNLPPNAKSPSGHVCVVQAVVHQDGDPIKGSAASPSAVTNSSRHSQRSSRAWTESIYEPLAGGPARVKAEIDVNPTPDTSIELTADQVRQLIRAIAAAQSGNGASPGGCWSSGGMPIAAHIPERDVALKPSAAHHHRTIHRNDSFEGHEEAVRMLVGAIQEIQQLCSDKKPSD